MLYTKSTHHLSWMFAFIARLCISNVTGSAFLRSSRCVEYLSNESPATCKTSELLHYTNPNPTCTSLSLRNRLKIIGRVIICFGAVSYMQWNRLICTPILSSPTGSHEHQHGDFPLSSASPNSRSQTKTITSIRAQHSAPHSPPPSSPHPPSPPPPSHTSHPSSSSDHPSYPRPRLCHLQQATLTLSPLCRRDSASCPSGCRPGCRSGCARHRWRAAGCGLGR